MVQLPSSDDIQMQCNCSWVVILLQGVKRIGLSLELSYSSIRKYATNYLNRLVASLLNTSTAFKLNI